MIESGSHGDEYDGVVFSQLVNVWSDNLVHELSNCRVFIVKIYVYFSQNLIDLAGSESSKTETTGLRRKEGSYINKSLLTLGTVSDPFFQNYYVGMMGDADLF